MNLISLPKGHLVKKSLSLFITLTCALSVEAQEKICNSKNYEELVKCALDQALEIQVSEQKFNATKKLEGMAKQLLNPELQIQNLQKGSEKSETSATLLFDVRLGGKRAAALNEAQGEIQKSSAEKDLSVAQFKLDLMLKLYRLTHLNHELKIEDETINTFSKIISQFQSKPALTPEQEVSLSIFKIATSEHQLNLVWIKNESQKLVQDISSSTNLPKDLILKNLPQHKLNWPEVSEDTQSENSPHVRFATGDLQIARALKEKSDAEVWPDLKIGPSFKVQKDGSAGTENFVGLSLSIPLAILNQNTAGRAYSSQKVVEAQLVHTLTARKVSSLREQFIQKYRTTVASLRNLITDASAEEKHKTVERHFFKGMISSSLVIEAHRQLIEFEEKRNESEREAIEALGSILIMDNKISEVTL